MGRKHLIVYALGSAACFVIFVQPALAAGFYLQEQSVSGLGAAFAGQAAIARDASIVYFNPAAMTQLDGAQMNAAVHLLSPSTSITNTGSTIDTNPAAGVTTTTISGDNGGNPYDLSPLPNLHMAMPLANDRLWAGFSLSAPFGLANEYNEGWFGRFDSTKTELKTIDLAPSLAYKINDRLSIGGGVNVQFAEAELNSAVRVVSEGDSSLKGKDWSAGYNAGLFFKPTPTTDMGLHYRSKISHTLDGRIVVTGTGSAAVNRDDSGVADLNLPDIAQFAIAQDVNERLTLLGSATWFGWNRFESIRAVNDAGTEISNVVQNYQTTWAFAVGAEYTLSDEWTVRGGYQFDETPTTDEYRTSRTPDGDRNWFSGGGTYKINDVLSLDIAATYIHVGEGTLSLSRNIPTALADIRADTEGEVGIFAMGLNYKF